MQVIAVTNLLIIYQEETQYVATINLPRLIK